MSRRRRTDRSKALRTSRVLLAIALCAGTSAWVGGAGGAAHAETVALADPTRPAFALPPLPATPLVPAARLTAVVIGPDERRAELDGRWVRVGDRVGPARVEAITLTGIRLRGRRGSFEIPLVATRVNKRPAEGGGDR